MKYYRLLWETLGRQRWWHSVPRRRIRITVPMPPATSRALLLSLTAVCNANKMRDCDIADTKLKELSKEMRDLETLKAATLMCKHCKKRLLIDKPIGNKIYCQCENNKAVEDETSGWQPFLETEDIVIWRKEEQPGNGLYAYKVYGRYPEVTAEDFLAMHTDLSYWRSWDETALSLKTLSQPIGHRSQQDVIHWETLWPRFFANRDYVYVRRYAYMDSDLGANPVRPSKSKFGPTPRNTSYTNDATIKDFASDKAEDDTSKSSSEKAVNGDKASHGDDHVSKQRILGLIDDAFGTSNYLNRNVEALGSARKESKGVKVIVMTSQSCEHPDAPVTKKAHRVTRYWSNLVIKPFTEIDKPGIEFSLTYFDDPGTSIPSALQTWVAGHACPDFLARMRVAAASYRDTRHQQAPSVEEILNKAKEKETKEEEIPSPVHTEMPQAVVGEEKGDTPPVVEQAEGNRQSHEDEPISLKSYLPEEPLSTEKDSAKAKSDRETQEFLDLLNGRKTDESPPVSVEEVSLDTDKQIGDATDDRTMEKVKSEDPIETNKKDDFRVNERLKDISLDQGHDLQTKEVSQASYNGYWRIWPLYYFA